MKNFAILKARTQQIAAQTRAKMQWMLLAPMLAVGLAHPAMAALPTMTPPTEGLNGMTCGSTEAFDITCVIGAYMKQNITMITYALVGIGVVSFIIYALMQWRQLSNGRIENGEFFMHLGICALVIGVIVLVASVGLNWL